MEVADKGVVWRNAPDGRFVIETHVELHTTDAFYDSPSDAWVQVVTDTFAHIGNYTIDVCLQETGGGPGRTLTATSHLYHNFTFP